MSEAKPMRAERSAERERRSERRPENEPESLRTRWPHSEPWRAQNAEEAQARDGRANAPLASSGGPK